MKKWFDDLSMQQFETLLLVSMLVVGCVILFLGAYLTSL